VLEINQPKLLRIILIQVETLMVHFFLFFYKITHSAFLQVASPAVYEESVGSIKNRAYRCLDSDRISLQRNFLQNIHGIRTPAEPCLV
jgi:hypothetical protein